MTSIAWRPVGAVDPLELGEARHQAHNAIQWPARMARTYIEPAADDSHTALTWLAGEDALVTGEVAPGITVEFRIADLALQFMENGKRVSHELRLDDRTPAEAEAWLLVEMLHRDMDRDRFSKDLPYKFAGFMTGDARHYHGEDKMDALRELMLWYANAASVLDRIVEDTASLIPGPSPVRCWPHHFDIATLISLEEGDSETARSIGVGMVPGDGYYGEPYFYVTLWPKPDDISAPNLPDIGQWHTKDFVGAVLTGSQIVDRKLTGDEVLGFLRTAIDKGRERLGSA